jgi:hypothetical protein
LELPPGMAGAAAAQLPEPTVSPVRGVAVAEQLGQGQAWSPQAIVASHAVTQLRATGREVLGPV